MNTAVIIPTLGRNEQAQRCVERFLQTGPTDVVLCIEDGEDEYPSLIGNDRVKFVHLQKRTNAIDGNNAGLAEHPNYDAYFIGADDLWPDEGWLNEILFTHGTTGASCISINDGHIDGNQLGTHVWMTRYHIVKHNGGVLTTPWYRSWCADVEFTERAKRVQRYAWAERSKVEHRHQLWSGNTDRTYERAKPKHIYDQLTCEFRRRNGWPDDFEAVIK